MKKFPWLLSICFSTLCACSDSLENIHTAQNSDDIRTNSMPILVQAKERIVDESKHNAVVGIYIRDYPDYADQAVCSGTLITPRHILTAAHCVADLSKKFALMSQDEQDPMCHWTAGYVSVGAKELFNHMGVGFGKYLRGMKRPIEYQIKNVVYHSGYAHVADVISCTEDGYDGYEFTQNDIAIIELVKEVPNVFAEPIPVLPPWLGLTQSMIDEGIYAVFLGYGYNSQGIKGIREWMDLPLTMYCSQDAPGIYCPYDKNLSISGCHPHVASCAKYGVLDYIDNRIAVPKGALFYLQNGKGPCTGDSGGPAIVTVGNQQYIAGITSYGDNACRNYGISLAVQDYYDWIVKNVPEVTKYYAEVCDNGLDDDNNGLIDRDDPVCSDFPYCGDGMLGEHELCEGDLFFNGETRCEEWNFKYGAGNVTCNDDCTLDYSQCVLKPATSDCGNGVLDPGESCDGDQYAIMGEVLPSNLCSDASAFFKDGTLSCNSNCTLDTTQCIPYTGNEPVCGNGITEGHEECDGDFFENEETISCRIFDSWYISGEVRCNDDCTFDLSQCESGTLCGDHFVTGDEPCDGARIMLDATQCSDWYSGFESGDRVRCNANCSLDYSACRLNAERAALCGNGVLDDKNNDFNVMAEECDGELFARGNNCTDWDTRYSAGKVMCTDNCTVDMSRCILRELELFSDEGYALDKMLGRETRPKVMVPVKNNDSVKFVLGEDNQVENLTFRPLETPSTPMQPDDPPAPENPSTPGDSQPAEPTESGSSSGGCSASPHAPVHVVPWILFGIFGLMRRRRTH